jgi:hypothetical protein
MTGGTEIHILWEGLLARPGAFYTARTFQRASRWLPRRALDLYATNFLAVGVMWELWQADQQVIVRTHLAPKVAASLPARLLDDGIPNAGVVVSTPTETARVIGLAPQVTRIYHGYDHDRLLYGPKGVYIDPADPRLLGKV